MKASFTIASLAALACGGRPAAPPPAEPVLPHESFTLESKALGETRRVNVYLPPGYAEETERRYPVLYMPDGGLKEDFPHVIRTVDTAIRAGEMRAVVVVGIENTERRRDLTGPTEVMEDRKIAPRVGGSAAFRTFLVDELRPQIEHGVRASGENGLIGESLAGLFVVETLLLQPDAFDVYVALSPSLWWNGGALLRQAPERLRAAGARPTAIYFAVAADDDLRPAAQRLADALREAPETVTWNYDWMPDATHATIYRLASPKALRKVYPPSSNMP